ncbi:hypothetical protein GGTG_12506 [Gaeumannomyces tritici R3-111a-1]|uniref:Uncharacterized protein n=1 Tax=Gaeumannomyces tritici (strain R3-111a-1) TaxID=644352 RepID=J3PG82_GAET3|nr:hypothetical protein GGTG_12506 [Gaeumannomyces tritici R3-111a-1]EJT69622.1 hypothetical protein GGTG_12506 [Gaeumannomyces tritici R3-111a-1]
MFEACAVKRANNQDFRVNPIARPKGTGSSTNWKPENLLPSARRQHPPPQEPQAPAHTQRAYDPAAPIVMEIEEEVVSPTVNSAPAPTPRPPCPTVEDKDEATWEDAPTQDLTRQVRALITALNKADIAKLPHVIRAASAVKARKTRRRRVPIAGAEQEDVVDVAQLLRQANVEISLLSMLNMSPQMREEVRGLLKPASKSSPAAQPQAVALTAAGCRFVGVTRSAREVGEGDPFEIRRRPQNRDLGTAPQHIIDIWFAEQQIQISAMADTPARVAMVKRLCFTYKEVFVKTLEEICVTDLIQHDIHLVPDARPVRLSQKRYTPDQVNFSQQVFPQIAMADLIFPWDGSWGANTLFPLKPPNPDGSVKLDEDGKPARRIVHDFRPINSVTDPLVALSFILPLSWSPRACASVYLVQSPSPIQYRLAMLSTRRFRALTSVHFQFVADVKVAAASSSRSKAPSL